MIASLRRSRLVVLADQDKCRQDDCFAGGNQPEERKWEWVEVMYTGNCVQRNPNSKPAKLKHDEGHASAEVRNCGPDPLGRASVRALSLIQRRDSVDVLLSNRLEGVLGRQVASFQSNRKFLWNHNP